MFSINVQKKNTEDRITKKLQVTSLSRFSASDVELHFLYTRVTLKRKTF